MEDNTSKAYVGRADGAPESLLAVNASQSATSLFIINLCSSIAPVQVAGKTIPGFETYKLYQVARAEDGRTRHRLRLGFFTSEADAENVLSAVRDNYPTAFVACLSDDDRRFARGYLPDTESTASWKRPVALVQKPAAVPPAPAATAPVAREPAKPAAAKPAPAPAAPAAKPATPAPTAKAAETPQAPAVTPAATQAAKPQTKSQTPITDAAGLAELEWEPQSKSTNASATSAPATSTNVDEIEISWEPPALQATKSPAPSDAAPAVAAQTVAAVSRTDTVIKARPAEPAKAAKPQAPAAKPVEHKATIELTLEKETTPAKPAVTAPVADPAQPFHVGKGADIPATALSLEATAKQPAIAPATPAKSATQKAAAQPAAASTPAAATARTPAATAPAKPAAAAASPAKAPATPAPAAKAPTSNAPAATPRGPELDSTQTIRALTSAEMNDEEKWFAIQLVVSEQPVNLDAMPHLDIFEAYRVYSIANAGSGKIVYSLRLGFFREEVSASAVSGYLKTFFPSPSVLRISTAEQLRFKDAPAPKATSAAASAKAEAKVIELNPTRDRKPAIPTVTMEVSPGGDRSPTGTFKTSATGSYKVNASGTHKALKPAARTAPPATKRSAPLSKSSSTGKHKALQAKKSLNEQLMDEARDVQLSESAIRKLPKNDSLLSRLVDKLTK